MPLEYRYHDSKPLVERRAYGVLRPSEILARWQDIMADPRFRDGLCHLFDLSDVRCEITGVESVWLFDDTRRV